jgi:hypothetical protein
MTTTQAIEEPGEAQNRAAEAAIALVIAAQHLPEPEEYGQNTLRDFLAAATGITGFDSDTPVVDESRIIPAIQEAVRTNTEVQPLANDFMLREYGREIDFAQWAAPERGENVSPPTYRGGER